MYDAVGVAMHRPAALVVLAVALSACSSNVGPDDSEPAANSAGDALSSAATAGFVMPDLSDDARQNAFASYAHVDPDRAIADNLLGDALAYYDANKARLKNKAHIAIVDFSQASNVKRLYLVDMESGAVERHAVAHGSGSDDGNGRARTFSDTSGSHQSSLGFVLTAGTFSGNHGRSLLLDGLSPTNAHMRSRAIIIHGATYVSDAAPRAGRSWGCFALDTAIKDAVITKLANGALLYAGLGEPNTGTRPTSPASGGTPAPSPTGEPECTVDDDCGSDVNGVQIHCRAGVCE